MHTFCIGKIAREAKNAKSGRDKAMYKRDVDPGFVHKTDILIPVLASTNSRRLWIFVWCRDCHSSAVSLMTLIVGR
jgi:hypothetical protein